LPHSTSGSDPSQPLFPAPERSLYGQPQEEFKSETDFAELAACFTAPGAGGLAPELSAELALEIILNQIVEQACLATGADGAAIVLPRDAEMVCRATSGATAPALGSRLDTSSGLSGECARTLHTQRCGDVLTDTRADVEASERLGVRSVLVMPLLRGAELVGFFELFSSRPFAFGDRDERTLEALASRALANLDRASAPLPPVGIFSPPAMDIPAEDDASTDRADYLTLILATAVVLCAVLLGMLVGRHLVRERATTQGHAGVRSSALVSASAARNPLGDENPANKVQGARESMQPQASTKSDHSSSVPPGSLQVFENGKEVFHLSPKPDASVSAANNDGGAQPTSSLEAEKNEQPEVQPAPTAAEQGLLYRVEPIYPEEARQQGIQGLVVLDVYIGAAGTVDDVHLVSGPPQLTQAAVAAVKQWRFNPRQLNGHAVPMQTRITLNFRLSESRTD